MNCKPGDLAVIIQGPNAGSFVDVIRRAPVHDFFLPSMAYAAGAFDAWIIKALAPISVPTVRGDWRRVDFAVAEDYILRPIRGASPVVVTEQEIADAVADYLKVPA